MERQNNDNNNLPIIAKKFWKIIRVVYCMLRKGISKAKLLSDLSTMIMKRGKIAGKAAMQSLMFHHHHASTSTLDVGDYEFSCSNSPAYPNIFNLKKRKHHTPPPTEEELMAAAMEMISASPALPGFGATPMMVRQLRVTDSPFPLSEDQDSHHVDEAAEKFIMQFYSDLRNQNSKACLGYY